MVLRTQGLSRSAEGTLKTFLQTARRLDDSFTDFQDDRRVVEGDLRQSFGDDY